MNTNPAKRLGCGPQGAEEIKSHPWFASIDWEEALNMSLHVQKQKIQRTLHETQSWLSIAPDLE